jgi:hypothetical protein
MSKEMNGKEPKDREKINRILFGSIRPIFGGNDTAEYHLHV